MGLATNYRRAESTRKEKTSWNSRRKPKEVPKAARESFPLDLAIGTTWQYECRCDASGSCTWRSLHEGGSRARFVEEQGVERFALLGSDVEVQGLDRDHA